MKTNQADTNDKAGYREAVTTEGSLLERYGRDERRVHEAGDDNDSSGRRD